MEIDWQRRYRDYTDQVFNNKDVEATTREYWTEDFTNHYAPPGVSPKADGVQQQIREWLAAFPDTKVTVEDVIVSGDQLAARVLLEGTFQNPFVGIPPTHKRVAVREIAWYGLQGDRMKEIWPMVDAAGLMAQLQAK